MKYSIIIPVYNGKKTIARCLKSLVNQNYPKDKYEIVVVNDGSTDKTAEIVKRFPVKLINLKKNVGKIKAREIGTKAARFTRLAFINANCWAEKNWLATAKKANYQPLTGEVITDPKRSNADRFFYLMRKKIYSPFKEPAYIEHQDFYKKGKASGNLFCSKDLFLRCLPRKKRKYTNEDNELFYNFLKNTKILYHPKLKIYHFERTRVGEIFKQWLLRGSTFTDFYFVHTKKYLHLLLIVMGVFTAVLLIGILNPMYLLYEVLASVFLLIIISLYFCEKPSDFRILFPHLVLVAFAASLGVVRRMTKLFFLYFALLILAVIYFHKLGVL